MDSIIAVLQDPLKAIKDIPFRGYEKNGAADAGLAGVVGAVTAKILFNATTPLALAAGALYLYTRVITLVSTNLGNPADDRVNGAVATGLAGVVGAVTAKILFNAATPLIAGAICAYAAAINLMAVTITDSHLNGSPKRIVAMSITITLLLSLGASMAGCPVPLTLALLLSVETVVSTALGLYLSDKYLQR